MELSNGEMVDNIGDNGKTENNMGWDFLSLVSHLQNKKENGVME